MEHDVVVIGASFAGLAAALQLARARRRVVVVDAGAPRNRFTRASHGFLGLDGRSPAQIRELGLTQLLAYPTVTLVEDEVIRASRNSGGFILNLKQGEPIAARRLLLAVGVVDALPDVAGLTERWGVSVAHCPYCHGYEFAGGNLGVLATGPQSIHQALMLPDWGPTTLFTQGVFKPDEEQSRTLQARGVVIEPVPVVALEGEGAELATVRLADDRRIALVGMFVAPQVSVVGSLATQLGCAEQDCPQGSYLQLNELGETSVQGVFAAGDAAMAKHNATLAAASGVLAGTGLHQSLIAEAISQGLGAAAIE
ncbi:NAD(P)/FAD-dependent oxidoreductase [Halopseudomonas pachastrellae]|uniref:NAD(P)/FAD-dependent oxidoreductase n=1 Tax=Halopseudomonas pachastrellae TaxID=254161 RepID=UPI003D7C9CB0